MREHDLWKAELATFAVGIIVTVVSSSELWSNGNGLDHALTRSLIGGFGVAVTGGCLLMTYIYARFAWTSLHSVWQSAIGAKQPMCATPPRR